jgi:hypothetical protein
MSIQTQFNLRVPQELKEKVEVAAKESGRSINAEAVYRLEQSFKGGGAPTEREKRILEQLELSQRTVKIFMHYLEALRDGDPMGDFDGIRAKYPDWFKGYDEYERKRLEEKNNQNNDEDENPYADKWGSF